MDLGLKGKSALVTGGSRGIGLAVANTLAAEGCALHLAARRQDDLEAAAMQIAKEHRVAVHIHPTDIANPVNAAALALECDEVDILVNNAGTLPGGELGRVDEERWRRAWELKVHGTITLTREVFEAMSERRAGVIVNIIGISGLIPDFGAVYGSSGNGALVAFTRALGGTSLDVGVRVVGVCPSFAGTRQAIALMERVAERTLGDPSRWRELLIQLPGQRPVEPHEVAEMVAFLASERARYVSGTVVPVDGGLSARGRSL